MVEAHIKLCKRMALSWIEAAKLDWKLFCAHAIRHAALLLNRMKRRVIDWQRPLTALTGILPKHETLGIFGSQCHVHVPAERRGGKGGSKANIGTYIGIDPDRTTEEPGALVYMGPGQIIQSTRHLKFASDGILNTELARHNHETATAKRMAVHMTLLISHRSCRPCARSDRKARSNLPKRILCSADCSICHRQCSLR